MGCIKAMAHMSCYQYDEGEYMKTDMPFLIVGISLYAQGACSQG